MYACVIQYGSGARYARVIDDIDDERCSEGERLVVIIMEMMRLLFIGGTP